MISATGPRFDRRSIWNSAPVIELWPSIDPTQLPAAEQKKVMRMCAALADLFGKPDVPVTEIVRQHRVQRGALYRIAPRCLLKHPDGRIYGFRAALPYQHIKPYERTVPVRTTPYARGGSAGAFDQLLRTFPSIDALLRSTISKRYRPVGVGGQVRQPVLDIFKDFIEACRQLGIPQDCYPFNTKRMGFRAVQAFVRSVTQKEFSMAVSHSRGTRSRAQATGLEQAPAATRAFEVVEFDGHKIDLCLTVRLIDPFGMEQVLELHRIWLLVVLDVYTRAVIGYHIALGKEYNKDDVAAALQSALAPAVPRQYSIPDLVVKEGGGFPSELIPATEFACWDWFRMDGAKSHIADDTLIRLNQIVGCWADNGPPAEPNARPFIERFFQLIARHFAHRLPGTVGNSPDAIERALSGAGKDINLYVELTELEDMIHALLSNYNGTAHKGVGGRTPLEAVAYSANTQAGFIRTLPTPLRSNLCLLQEARTVTIKGSTALGMRPHINFCHVRYSSSVLSTNAALIGQKVRIYYDVRDVRAIKAFFEDGSELGVLTAARPWNITPHSLRLRQEIHRMLAERKLIIGPNECPVAAWARKRWSEGKTSKRAANALAKAKQCALAAEVPLTESNAPAGAPPLALPEADPQPGSVETIAPIPTPLKVRRTIIF